MDLHASQIQGFFQVPIDNLYAQPTIARYIQQNIKGYENGVVVAKNSGAMKRFHFCFVFFLKKSFILFS